MPPEIIALADRLASGNALDLGCGTGTSSLYLASHGWQVTGVDFIPVAIRRARQKAERAHLSAKFYIADVTRLDFLEGPFHLAIDIGCFHSLSPVQMKNYGESLKRLMPPGATFALYALGPTVRGGRHVGVTPDEVKRRLAAVFDVVSVTLGKDKGDGPPSAWYELKRI